MRLRPFFSYYGSKHRIAARYPAPQTSRIVEPFAGSAAYACARPALDVLLIDSNPKVAGVWDYLIRAKAPEILALPILRNAETVDEVGSGLPDEAKWLIGFNLNMGSASPCKRLSSWGRKSERSDSERFCMFWGEAKRRRVANQVHYIRHWKVRCGNYWEAPDVEADWFVDPPYQGAAGKHYGQFGSSGLDYSALGIWTMERRGQVIACDNVGARWLNFSPLIRAKGTPGRFRSGTSHEAIYHRPLFRELTLFDVA